MKTPPKRKDKRGAPKGHRGNVKFVATDEQRIQVEALACVTKYAVIADIMGFSEDTLKRHFPAELERGKARALAKIGGSMVRDALDPTHQHYHDARRFVLSRLAGWKTTTAVENSGPDGGPIQHELRDHHDFSKLSIDEKRALEKLLAKAAGGDEPA